MDFHITTPWIICMAFLLKESVLVKLDATGIESSPLSGSEILAKWFSITDNSDRCCVEMQIRLLFHESSKNIAQDHFVLNTLLQWSVKIYGQIQNLIPFILLKDVGS